MFAFVTGAGYRLPFTTLMIDRFTRKHRPRDRKNLTWIEDMTLTVRVPALSFDAFPVTFVANNDNEARGHG